MKTFFPIPPDDMPPDTVCFILRVPNSPQWVSAVWWVLDQYNYWFNWQRTPDKRGAEVALRWRDMFWRAIEENKGYAACPVEISSNFGVDISEDIAMQIRISPDDSCIIQMWCIDHWEDWYDPRGCVPGLASQPPGGGTIEAGGCMEFDLIVQGNGKALLPVPVAAGYSVEISGAQGGWWDGNALHAWNCPSGQTYALGACVSTGATDGSSPIPELPIGRVVAEIDGVFYDAYNQIIAVPDGTADSDVYFQMNDATLDGNAGSITLHVRVCNQNAQAWEHTSSFVTSKDGFVSYPRTEHAGACAAQETPYISGEGWSQWRCPSQNATYANISRTFAPRTIHSVSALFNLDTAMVDGSEAVLYLVVAGVETQVDIMGDALPSGNSTLSASGTWDNVTGVRVRLALNSNTVESRIRNVVLSGDGTDPL